MAGVAWLAFFGGRNRYACDAGVSMCRRIGRSLLIFCAFVSVIGIFLPVFLLLPNGTQLANVMGSAESPVQETGVSRASRDRSLHR
jgi:hypothetical protein